MTLVELPRNLDATSGGELRRKGQGLTPFVRVAVAALAPGAFFAGVAAMNSAEPVTTFAWVFAACAAAAGVMWSVMHQWFARSLRPLQDAVDAFKAGKNAPIDADDAPREISHVISTLRDAAEAGRSREGALERALERNHILTREMHHRVQNNVQVLLSLVSRAQRRETDPNARAAIGELGANMLPVTGAFASVNPPEDALIVDGGEYLHRLAGQLQAALGGQSRGVRLTTEIELGAMPIDDAVDLGLIVAEVFLSAHPGAGEQYPLTAALTFSPPANGKLGVLRASVTFDDPARTCRKLDTVLITELARQLRAKVEQPARNAVAITWSATPI